MERNSLHNDRYNWAFEKACKKAGKTSSKSYRDFIHKKLHSTNKSYDVDKNKLDFDALVWRLVDIMNSYAYKGERWNLLGRYGCGTGRLWESYLILVGSYFKCWLFFSKYIPLLSNHIYCSETQYLSIWEEKFRQTVSELVDSVVK